MATSQLALDQIETLLDKLTDDNIWDLVNLIRDKCQVIIPVWFTIPLVQEITEESLGVELNKEETEQLVLDVNDSDSSYLIGRQLVENLIKHYLPEESSSEDDNECSCKDKHEE
jgi:hypothetical protein